MDTKLYDFNEVRHTIYINDKTYNPYIKKNYFLFW